MTGRLPHSHGVLSVTHTVDPDMLNLRTNLPHWAQSLTEAGYQTAFFGKWHVERGSRLEKFGWQQQNLSTQGIRTEEGQEPAEWNWVLKRALEEKPGYKNGIFYGVTTAEPEDRGVGGVPYRAGQWLDSVMGQERPWCCFTSLREPHDPFICGEDAFDLYDPDDLQLPPNANDDCRDKPGLYRQAQTAFTELSEPERRELAACYYGSITELDEQLGKLIDKVDRAGELENTLIVFTTDHGELLGAHGMYCKNFGGFREVYDIPLIIAGPGIAQGRVTNARVGSHDLCPTLLELVGARPFDTNGESRSFAGVCADPGGAEDGFTTGFAEYYGSRFQLSQRVYMRDQWKLVFNGFDQSELYDLRNDPHEIKNLIEDPAHELVARQMFAEMWRIIRDTGDHSLYNTHYPILRIAPYGPLLAEEAGE
jgi:arylsulfatase A-like enzyme